MRQLTDPMLRELPFLISLVVLAIGWTTYVFVVRVCVRMIQGRALSVGRGGQFAGLWSIVLSSAR